MEESINIQDIIDSLMKRWKLVVICVLSCTLIASIFTFFIIEPTYKSSAKVFIGKESSQGQAYDQSELMMYQKLQKTFAEVIKTKDLVKASISNIQTDRTVSDVMSNLSVDTVVDTQILQINYVDTSSSEALKILNSVKDEFMKLSNELIPNVNIKVIEEPRENTSPIAPSKSKNIAISILLGLMVGVGLVFLLEFLDNSFKTKDQLEKELDLPVLGTIPDLRGE